MLRTLKSLSTLFALMVMVVAATTIAQVGTAKSVSSVSRGGTGKVAAGAYDYNLNVIVPTANPTFDATGRWISNAATKCKSFRRRMRLTLLLLMPDGHIVSPAGM